MILSYGHIIRRIFEVRARARCGVGVGDRQMLDRPTALRTPTCSTCGGTHLPAPRLSYSLRPGAGVTSVLATARPEFWHSRATRWHCLDTARCETSCDSRRKLSRKCGAVKRHVEIGPPACGDTAGDGHVVDWHPKIHIPLRMPCSGC